MTVAHDDAQRPGMAIRLVITVDDSGQMRLDGPIHDKLICYGVLEAAKMAIREFQQPRVAPASVIPDLAVVKNGRG